MPLGMEVGLGPGHIVLAQLDGDSAPPRKGAQQPPPTFLPTLLWHACPSLQLLSSCWCCCHCCWHCSSCSPRVASMRAFHCGLVVALVSINKVTVCCWAWLVLGWVTRGKTIPVCNQPSRSTLAGCPFVGNAEWVPEKAGGINEHTTPCSSPVCVVSQH